MKAVIYIVTALAVLCTNLAYASLLTIQPESVEAEAWTIVDTHSGQVIAEHNSQVHRAPASLTKMMVAYIVLKDIAAGKIDQTEVLTASNIVATVQADESQMRIKVGQQISIDQLLAGLIIMSANDGALMLAERVSGSVPAFLERMNQEAQDLNMLNTYFQNPAGITMPQHYSTAADLALLSQALVTQTPEYLNYSKQPSFSYGDIFHPATNLLLARDSSVDGLKTGFTKAAGYNLALTAQRPTAHTDARRLVVVVLGSKNAQKRAEVAHKLLNLAYTYTRNEAIVKANQHLADVPVSKSLKTWYPLAPQAAKMATVSLYPSDQIIDLNQFKIEDQRLHYMDVAGYFHVVEPQEQAKIHLRMELKQHALIAPIDRVMPLALIHVYQGHQLVKTIEIDEPVQLEQANMWQQMVLWFEGLMDLFTGHTLKAKTYPLD